MLQEYPIVVERNLEWGDMDAYNHVNNVVYFRFFENARIAYFEKIFMLAQQQSLGIGPILKSTSCIFRVPLVFPDRISVGAKVSKIERDRFLMRYAVFSQKLQRITTEGEGLIVSFNYNKNEKTPLSPQIIKAIEALESSQACSA